MQNLLAHYVIRVMEQRLIGLEDSQMKYIGGRIKETSWHP
jgi:hypothetical protein